MARRHLVLLRRYLTYPAPLLSFPKTRSPLRRRRRFFSGDQIPVDLRNRILLLTEKKPDVVSSADVIRNRIYAIADEILAANDVKDVEMILERSSFGDMVRTFPDGAASVQMLSRFGSRPLRGLEVFNWMRKQVDAGLPLIAEDYSKAITLASRIRNMDLVHSLFKDAVETRGIRSTSLYNAFMAAYMCNGDTEGCHTVFKDLKEDPDCDPTIVTYNILLSAFGRSFLVNHIELLLQTIDESNDVSRNLRTYNTVIGAYIKAREWDKMENTYQQMEAGSIQPDPQTHFLMLRGYAYSDNIEKMEETYELVKELVNNKELHLIRVMICAYCRSSRPDRIRKIEELAKLIPDEEYRRWLNVLMIRVYAQEGLVEYMDQLICQAFKRHTIVTSSGIMRAIISGYFQCGAVERLATFVSKAEHAGWRICRSLYHCKMVMYGQQNRLEEMHGVLDEMEFYKFDRTKKTYMIMFKAYFEIGRRTEAESILGLMWKNGFANPEDFLVS